jgi:hypothetical protein
LTTGFIVHDAYPPAQTPTDSDLCRRRAEVARALAAKARDAAARVALEVVAANWESLGRHLTRCAAQPVMAVETSRKAQARRAALGIDA